MTNTDLAAIETALTIALPREYRDVMLARGAELRRLTFKYNGEPRPFFGEELYLDQSTVIQVNLAERPKGSGTGYAFPKWWKTFFMFGTNGAGDFYTLRLDNEPGVYLIGSDCGDEAERTHASLTAYIEECLAEYKAEVVYVPPPPRPTFYEAFTPAERQAYEKSQYVVPAGVKPFMDRIIAAPEDNAPRLELAAAMEENGLADRANFMRARCALDDRSPMPDTYPDAVELLAEANANIPWKAVPIPPGFSFYSSDRGLSEWWSDRNDGMERGLPSFATIKPESSDDTTSAEKLVRQLPALIRTTPIRGLDLEWRIPQQTAKVFAAPEASELTRLEFDSRPEENKPCPVIAALAKSPVARNLTRLMIGTVAYDANVNALADAPFDRLRRFDSMSIGGSPEAARRLRTSQWFRSLHRHCGTLSDAMEGDLLSGMPYLHTLCLWFPTEDALIAMGNAGDFPALRRLFIHAADLRKDVSTALAIIRSPELVELWLRNSDVRLADLRTLLAAPWASELQVLTLEIKFLSADAINVIADSPCAKHLRILRFAYSGFPRLAGTALGTSGAFPKLSTLMMDNPFSADDPEHPTPEVKDTAEFVRTLQTTSLKHLTLSYCDYNSDCDRARISNPALSGVTAVKTS